MTQVFISYSRKDLAFVQRLATDLQNAGLDVWWDLSGTKGGDEWERKIGHAIEQSQYFIVVLTPDSVESRWVTREYLKADEMGLKIIPLIYKLCKTPLTLQDRQKIDVEGNYSVCLLKVLSALNVNPGGALQLESPATPSPIMNSFIIPADDNRLIIGTIEFIKIPAGKLLIGSKDDNPLAFNWEKPQHTLELSEFWIAKFPLTNEQYSVNINTAGHPVKGWEKKKNHPVVNVYRDDAMQYCRWFNQKYQHELRQHHLTLKLPTEAQWEKGARGEYGNEWPWGNEYDSKRCNTAEGRIGDTTPVNAYPQGESPYGVADLIGNVWEWTSTLFKEYPYKVDESGEDGQDSGGRVVRGGSFYSDHRNARCACRLVVAPGLRNSDIGFRVCLSETS
jgi:formylglycine-generating enzyme required for sulfatase activity